MEFKKFSVAKSQHIDLQGVQTSPSKGRLKYILKSVGLRALIYRLTNCVHTRVTLLSLQVTRKDKNFQSIVTLHVLQVQP
jgi:hypothetical protein